MIKGNLCLVAIAFLSAQICSKVVIYGDSHSEFSYEGFPYLRKTIYAKSMFAATAPKTFDFTDVHAKDTLIFNFGEVDVRLRTKHQAEVKQKRNYTLVMNALVKNHVERIKISIKEQFNSDVNVILASIVPTSSLEYLHIGELYDRICSDQFRSACTYYMNKLLYNAAKENGWRYFDYYQLYSDSRGFLVHRLGCGGAHVGKAHNGYVRLALSLFLASNNFTNSEMHPESGAMTLEQVGAVIDSTYPKNPETQPKTYYFFQCQEECKVIEEEINRLLPNVTKTRNFQGPKYYKIVVNENESDLAKWQVPLYPLPPVIKNDSSEPKKSSNHTKRLYIGLGCGLGSTVLLIMLYAFYKFRK